MIRTIVAILIVLGFFAGLVWASDRVTLQGERTLYGVNCNAGTWNGLTCTTNLVAGNQYVFRASHARQEVLYWIRYSSEPSGRHAKCEVTNRDNWQCEAGPQDAQWVVHELAHGRPTASAGGAAQPLHGVAKWKWYLLKWGLYRFDTADY
jgi:hypothetical protein